MVSRCWSSLLTNTMLQCPEWDCQIKLWQDDVLSSKLSNVIFRGNFIIICHLKWESKNIRKNISARHKKSLCKLFNDRIFTYFNLRKKIISAMKGSEVSRQEEMVEEYNLCWQTQWWGEHVAGSGSYLTTVGVISYPLQPHSWLRGVCYSICLQHWTRLSGSNDWCWKICVFSKVVQSVV